MRCIRITQRMQTGGPRIKKPKGWGAHSHISYGKPALLTSTHSTQAYPSPPSDVVRMSPEKKDAIIIRCRLIARRIVRNSDKYYDSEVGPAVSSSAQVITDTRLPVTGQARVLPTSLKKQQNSSRFRDHWKIRKEGRNACMKGRLTMPTSTARKGHLACQNSSHSSTTESQSDIASMKPR